MVSGNKRKMAVACLAFAWLVVMDLHGGIGGRHLAHLFAKPKDLYAPIILEACPLWEKGYAKSYTLNPKYMDYYEVGLLCSGGTLPAKETFKGKLKITFRWKDTVVSEHVVDGVDGGVYAGKDLSAYKKASLLDFKVPLNGKYKEQISMDLMVLEGDERLKAYGSALKLYVGVRSAP
jgi:hypothetical protein